MAKYLIHYTKELDGTNSLRGFHTGNQDAFNAFKEQLDPSTILYFNGNTYEDNVLDEFKVRNIIDGKEEDLTILELFIAHMQEQWSFK